VGTAEDLIRGFGHDSNDDKLVNFEVSTLSEVLKQLGWTASKVAAMKAELDAAFSWDWFNNEGFLKNARVGSTRVFRFDFFELLTKPTDHPITRAFAEFKDDSSDPCCLVFKVFDHGRWVATNLTATDDPHLHVATAKLTFNILPFSKFFQRRWGETT
jgi:hypothetical protein